MTEIIHFRVNGNSERTFEIPMQKVKEIMNKYFPEVNLSKLTPLEVAEYIWNNCSIGEFFQYEIHRDSFKSRVVEGIWYDTTIYSAPKKGKPENGKYRMCHTGKLKDRFFR